MLTPVTLFLSALVTNPCQGETLHAVVAAKPPELGRWYTDAGVALPRGSVVKICGVSGRWSAGSKARCQWPGVCARKDLPMNAIVMKVEPHPAAVGSLSGQWVRARRGTEVPAPVGGRLVFRMNESTATYRNYLDNSGRATVGS